MSLRLATNESEAKRRSGYDDGAPPLGVLQLHRAWSSHGGHRRHASPAGNGFSGRSTFCSHAHGEMCLIICRALPSFYTAFDGFRPPQKLTVVGVQGELCWIFH